jgi:hypothetical protein
MRPNPLVRRFIRVSVLAGSDGSRTDGNGGTRGRTGENVVLESLDPRCPKVNS